MDKETQQVYNRGLELKNLVKSEGWKIFKEEAWKRLADLVSVMGIDTEKDKNLVAQIGARQLAHKIITGLLKEIEGEAEQYDNNTKGFEEEDENIIERFD